MLWEYIVTGIIIAASVAIVARKAYRSVTGKSRCGFGCQSECLSNPPCPSGSQDNGPAN